MAGGAALMPGAAPAQENGSDGSSWLCNAKSGDYETKTLDTGDATKIEGTLVFELGRSSGAGWIPMVTIQLGSPGEGVPNVGLVFSATMPDRIVADIVGGTGQRKRFGVFRRGTPMRFGLELTEDGLVKASVDDKSRTLTGSNGRPKTGLISCSTARARFSDLSAPVAAED